MRDPKLKSAKARVAAGKRTIGLPQTKQRVWLKILQNGLISCSMGRSAATRWLAERQQRADRYSVGQVKAIEIRQTF